jgi:methionine synthase II (cobalamin-independent)
MNTIESNIIDYPENSITKDLIFLEHDNPEFKSMFEYFPDPLMENKELGEVLQYMGTVIERNKIKGSISQIYHQFRHRALPGTNERKYWNISASDPFIFDYVVRLKNF